jgi:hypothetical protein
VPAARYSNGDGTFIDFDEVVWTVDVPADKKDGQLFRVVVRLLYQSTTPEYVEFLRTANTTTDRGTNLQTIWDNTSEAAPFEMASVQRDIRVVQELMAGGGGGSDGTGGGGGGAATGGMCGCGSAGGSIAVLVLAVALLRSRVRKRHSAI